MISVQDGQNQILSQLTEPTPPEVVAVTRARERVLAEDLHAPFDVPPTDNSAVDGYAVASDDVPTAKTRELDVVAELPAGAVFEDVVASGQTVRIMTGAPMPRGADTVYPQEVVERRGDLVSVGPIPKGANGRKRGEDIQAGTIAIERGTVLRPQELGRFTLRGSIEQCGGEVVALGIVADVRDQLRARLLEAAEVGDIIVTSGGVSVGVLDLVKEVLDEIGAINFWQVAMQPGRPLAVGRVGSAHFFGLPGNPVASMLAFMLFVRPAIYKLAGRRRLFPETFHARADEPLRKKTGRREFKRGIVHYAHDEK